MKNPELTRARKALARANRELNRASGNPEFAWKAKKYVMAWEEVRRLERAEDERSDASFYSQWNNILGASVMGSIMRSVTHRETTSGERQGD